jgi:hypothetical protein
LQKVSVVSDGSGGAWAAWVARDGTGTVEELWVSHHLPAAGWTAPVRLAAAGRIPSFRIAAGKSGHAVVAWDESPTVFGGTATPWIAFHDPGSGWSAREPVEDGAGMPVAMDDTGVAMVSLLTVGATQTLSTRLHRPDTGWEPRSAPVSLSGLLHGVQLAMQGMGDASLVWNVVDGERCRSASLRPALLAGVRLVGARPGRHGRSLSPISFASDGSVWMLGTAVTPHVQAVSTFFTKPRWLLRYEPGSGWVRPQLLIDDAELVSSRARFLPHGRRGPPAQRRRYRVRELVQRRRRGVLLAHALAPLRAFPIENGSIATA